MEPGEGEIGKAPSILIFPSRDRGARNITAWYEKENERLVGEMATDQDLQFRTFTFAATASLAILGYILKDGSVLAFSTPFVWVTLVLPIFLTVPATFLILNRARTRNRKAAYVISVLDRERIIYSHDNRIPETVDDLKGKAVPWETALVVLRGKPHHAKAILVFGITFVLIESSCVLLVLRSTFGLTWPERGAVLFVFLLWAGSIYLRYRVFRNLRRHESIQGFIETWLKEVELKAPYLNDVSGKL